MDKTELFGRIAKDEFLGYELYATKQLHKRLPIGHSSFEDVLAWIRVYALEAAVLYDPTRKTRFSTFLFGHLKQKSLIWFNWAWLKKSHPSGYMVFTFSQTVDEDGNEPDYGFEQAPQSLEVEEFLNALSTKSKEFFQQLLDDCDEGLLTDLHHRWRATRVSRRYSVSKETFQVFVDEVQQKAERYTWPGGSQTATDGCSMLVKKPASLV